MLSVIDSACLLLRRRDKLTALEPLCLILHWASIHSLKPRLPNDLTLASPMVLGVIRGRVLLHLLLLLQIAMIHHITVGSFQ